jgi:hypothetical protein
MDRQANVGDMTGHRSGFPGATGAPCGAGRTAWATCALATVATIVAAALLTGVAHAGLSQQVFFSKNNKLYLVV